MDAQRSPEVLSTQDENELICEELLGWSRDCRESEPGWIEEYFWRLPDRTTEGDTPSFTTWAEAGLILDALMAAGANAVPYLRPLSIELVQGLLTPFSIRMAAIEYIRSLP